MEAATVDVSGLNARSLRTVVHVIAWLRRATANEKHQGRYEIVVGEGKVKVAHVTWTIPPEDMAA